MAFRKRLIDDIIRKVQNREPEKDAANYLYHTFWFLIRKTDRVVVGSEDFKDVPAVQAMCHWALEQENVSHIIAETDGDGF